MKKETILGFIKVNVPLRKWMAKHNLLCRIFYKNVYWRTSLNSYKMFKQYCESDSEEEFHTLIQINLTKIQKITFAIMERFYGHIHGFKKRFLYRSIRL